MATIIERKIQHRPMPSLNILSDCFENISKIFYLPFTFIDPFFY